MPNRIATLMLGVVFLAIAGCGPSHVQIHGMVTANGKAVEEGAIAFHPTDGKNSSYGGEIKNGSYTTKVNPGKYSVVITGGGKSPAYPKSQEDLKKFKDEDLERRDQVPGDAKGNNQEVEITSARELNITLEFPAPKK
jgi:uncharacterized membrane protein